ncbi:MAG: OFA family MFS transporter [Dehalococcoidales bacterium]|nr:OFA family MFS transporter [Dehalococcoidales bacterium]
MVEKSDKLKVFGMKAETGRWLFVVFGLIIQLCLGAVYAWGTFKKPIMTHFSLDATVGALPFIIFLAFFAILMPFGGRWIQKYGPCKMGIIGGILVGVGWFLAGFATNLLTLCLTYGVLAGAGVGLAYGAPIQASTRWFPDKKGLAVGLTVGGFGLSAAAIAPIGNALINANDVTFMFKIFGAVFLVLTILLSFTLKFPAPNWKPAGWAGPKAGAPVAQNFTPSQMFKTPSFWALFLCFIFGSTAGLMAIGIASPVGQEVIKISAGLAATLTAVFAVFNFGGRPIFGWLTDRITPSKAAVVSFVLIALGSVGILFFASEGATAIYIISFALLWMALGGWLAIAPTATATFFGTVNNSSNYGIVFIAYGLGAIIGNIVSGRAKDLFGSYDIAFLVTLILAVVGLVLATVMLKPPKNAPAAPAKVANKK